MGKERDITGMKFGRLTAISFQDNKKHRSYWNFQCECGNSVVFLKGNVTCGNTLSCGCLHSEITKSMIKDRPPALKHGMEGTRFYRIWNGMKQRCTNSKVPGYKIYGGRGIYFITRWYKFEEFKKDLYQSYLEHVEKHGEDNTSLDRINNDAHYTKRNCRWATRSTQALNRRPRIHHGKGKKDGLQREGLQTPRASLQKGP